MDNVSLCIIYASSWLHGILPCCAPWCSFLDGKSPFRIPMCWNMLEPLNFLLNTASLFGLCMVYTRLYKCLDRHSTYVPTSPNPWTFPNSPPFLLIKSVKIHAFLFIVPRFPWKSMVFSSSFPRFSPGFTPKKMGPFAGSPSRNANAAPHRGTHGHQGIHGFRPAEATRDGLEERQSGGPVVTTRHERPLGWYHHDGIIWGFP